MSRLFYRDKRAMSLSHDWISVHLRHRKIALLRHQRRLTIHATNYQGKHTNKSVFVNEH